MDIPVSKSDSPAASSLPTTDDSSESIKKSPLAKFRLGSRGISILLIVFVLLLTTGFYLFFSFNSSKSDLKVASVSGIFTPTPARNANIATTVSLTPIRSEAENLPEVKKYQTRFFDTNKSFYSGVNKSSPYPTELANIPDTDLVPISCTKQYEGLGDKFENEESDNVTDKITTLTDPTLLAQIVALNKIHGENKVDKIMSCNSKGGSDIILYSALPCDGPGGGCYGTPYVATDDGKTVKDVAKLKDLRNYYSCYSGLELTKESDFYFQCGGGDGGGGARGIFKLNLKNLSVTPIIQCSSFNSLSQDTSKDFYKCE